MGHASILGGQRSVLVAPFGELVLEEIRLGAEMPEERVEEVWSRTSGGCTQAHLLPIGVAK
jgi:hypothetical protein